MDVEIEVQLNQFSLRWYQKKAWDAIMNGETKRLLLISPRRSGKDFLCWNIAIRQCIRKTCLVFYVLPTYSQARKAIWDAIAIDGTKFLDYIPKQLVESINQSDMKVRFKNGSILQCISGDSYDTSIVGTNPYAVILSEFALMPSEIFAYIRPILAANGGWCIINSTPRGKNHLWHLYKLAQELPNWIVIKQKTSEIGHIPADVLEEERRQMDAGLFEQEYETSFERGISGAYYGEYLDRLRLKGQITHVPYEPGIEVHVAFDIGVHDATTLIFFQVVGAGAVIRIIDAYSNNNLGLDHYVNYIKNKDYVIGKYFAPHDIKVREWGGGAVSRFEMARQMGVHFELVPSVSVMDGIEMVWRNFSKFWIDESNCRSLIDALENYRKEWDDKRQMYTNKPVRSWASHYADCLRYVCLSLPQTERGMSSEEFEIMKAKALYGDSSLPQVFKTMRDYRNPY